TLSHPELETVSCDILDVVSLEKVMQGIEYVYHCAALVSYDPKDRQRLLKINIEGTANVVNACTNEGIEKLVHVSSVAALGRIRPGEMVTEKMNWTEESSNSIYGKSKYYGEMEVWRGVAEGMKAVIVNPSLILGGDNWETGSSAIFKNAFNEFKWYTEGVSGCVDVRDVARAMILLMKSDISGKRFILSGENVPFRELFTSIAKCFGKKPPHKKVTPFLAELIWRLEAAKGMLTGGNRLLTKETVYTAQAKVYFDNSKILKALPQFHFTEIKNTIEFTCKQLKEKYHL
ncbi:MAG: NAD-dependent epimerase/dehydratase family protein, partial [Ginsengibacter sp.]